MKNFGERLKGLRESKGLTRVELGKLIGLDELPIKYWEESKRVFTITKIIEIAKFFGVTTDYILGL